MTNQVFSSTLLSWPQTSDEEKRNWRDRAACRALPPEMFFLDPADTEGIENVKQICAECPVASECLSYAVSTNQTEGVWGATTPGERRRLRQRWLKELKEAG